MASVPEDPTGETAHGPTIAGAEGAAEDPGPAEPGESTLHTLWGQLRNVERLLQLPGRAMGEVEERLLPAWRRRTDGEARWAVSVAVVLAIVLQLTLPAKLAFPPRWLLPTIGSALLVGLVVANPRRIDHRSTRLRATSILLTGVMSIANAVSAARLIANLLNGTATEDAGVLLRWGGAIWLTNVVVFALWYWELDRGGPGARAEGVRQYPDLLFAQMGTPNVAPSTWEPEFLDYFYLAFTNATAFSPTDVIPLSRWTKMMMLLQSVVSVSTLVLVIARAVNILK
ncbi:MAG: hypothetical protein ABI658_07450 [Acidimicrobiales bacterium]